MKWRNLLRIDAGFLRLWKSQGWEMAKAIVEFLAWMGLRALGVEDIAVGVIIFGMGVYCAAIAFGPIRWLTAPDHSWDLAEEFPYFTRALYIVGMLAFFGGLYLFFTM